MKKSIKFIVLLGALAAHCPVKAQEKQPVLMSVTYEFVHINDLSKPDDPIRKGMVLQLGKTTSKYISLASANNPIIAKQPTAAQASGPVRVVSGGPIAVVSADGITNEELFQDSDKKQFIKITALGMHDYKVESPLPVIMWKIYDEKRKIGGYSCQKAVGAYAGRSYTAWFAKDLPFQNGPWKLSGLPGLILEASDEKKEVQFLFKELSKPEEEDYTGTNRSRVVTVNDAALNKAMQAFKEDPAAAMQSQLPANAPVVQVAYRDASGKTTVGDGAKAQIEKDKAGMRLKKDNPLELN